MDQFDFQSSKRDIYIYIFMINEQVELGRAKMLQSLKAYFAELAKRDR